MRRPISSITSLIKPTIKVLLHSFFKTSVNPLLEYFNVIVIYRIGYAIGDQLCMSAVVKLMHEQYQYKIVVVSSYPEIFANNNKILKNIDANKYGMSLSRILRWSTGKQVVNFMYIDNELSLQQYMRNKNNERHLVEIHSKHFFQKLDYSNIVNEIYFTDDEVKLYSAKFKLPSNYSVISPHAKKTYTPNKQWDIGNFQKVIDFRNDIHWVQTGIDGDYLLDNVSDYVGKTTIRELFYIISKANFILSNEGLENHIASAFPINSYVIQSGISNVQLVKYKNTTIFESVSSCDKYPCLLLDKCIVNGQPCLSNIKPEQIATELF